MSKYHKFCCCIICRIEITTQSLSSHNKKHLAKPKNICRCCNQATNNLRFCSHSCRAKIINSERIRTEISKVSHRKVRKELLMERFLNGEVTERITLRKYIAKTKGYNCTICNITTWNDQAITLVVDHVDGNAGNNFPANLRLLCPNCNSQTPTFGGRNKGNGRKFRGLPLN